MEHERERERRNCSYCERESQELVRAYIDLDEIRRGKTRSKDDDEDEVEADDQVKPTIE